jgi:hypothetical protein
MVGFKDELTKYCPKNPFGLFVRMECGFTLVETKNTCSGAGFPYTLHYIGISIISPIPPCSAERTNSASLLPTQTAYRCPNN